MSVVSLLFQVIEEVQVRQPEVESVLERAGQLFKDAPPGQPDKVRKSDSGTNRILPAYTLLHMLWTVYCGGSLLIIFLNTLNQIE